MTAGPIVLVHGAWAGDWCWTRVDPLLRAPGRVVHAVALTGFGSRRHHSTPHVSLTDHVDDVVNLVEAFDLADVTLVGHSYGGRVVTRAAQRLDRRLSSVVFLDAHAPIGQDAGLPDAWFDLAGDNDGMLPFNGYDPDPADMGGEDAVAWFLDRVMPIPLACFTDPWWAPLPAHVRPTYVLATANRPSRFEGYAAAASADPAWRYAEIHAPHFLMLTEPEAVAEVVLAA